MKKSKVFLIKKTAILCPLSLFIFTAITISIAISLFLSSYQFPQNLPVDLKSQVIEFSFFKILVKNIFVSLLLISGFFLYKVSTVIVLLANAVSISFVLTLNIYTTGEVWYFLGLISIHGLVELSALMIAANIGFQRINLKIRTQRLAFRNTIVLILILLIISASLETFVTPLFWR
ncbi:stage II sporulation protein M [Lacticaseibacillus zeae]|uniref:Stage II sporulation protein M n=1 Tax=Lacticaseibacillus zeae TaxID=57037 RepID=A0A5R8M0X8_LACZE|nr:stage II sporulation protein M [Lacticaseibacillus zeae]